MDAILSRFRFEDGALINHQNRRFVSIAYESELHSGLAYQLQDPDLARIIYSAYSKHLATTLTVSEQELFSKALLRTCFLFGTPKYPPHLGLRLALLEEKFPVDDWMQRHMGAFKAFMEEANQSQFTAREPKSLGEWAHIVIITTSAAGGNEVVAEGVGSELRKNFKVTVLDVEKFSEEVDPLIIATGSHTYDRIYAEVIQQKNRLQEGFELQMNVGRRVARFIEPTLGLILKQKIHELKADFILSTRNGHQLDISFPYSLGIPGATLHCDCEVGYFYNDFVGKIQSQLFKIWLPDNHPRVFKPVLDRTRVAWETQQDTPWSEFRQILADAVQVPVSEIDEQIEFVGAPTRPQTHRIKDPAEISRLRKKWDLQPNEEAILVSMGKNGVGRTSEVFAELLASPAHQLSIKYIFVCGTNKSMQADFERNLNNANRSISALRRCAVYGLLSGDEMNELLNISILLQGKPGGAQKEECLKLGIPLMIVFSHDYWESGNQAKLEREGYALSYDQKQPLTVQTERHVAALMENKPAKVTRRKWKQLIPKAIQRVLNQ